MFAPLVPMCSMSRITTKNTHWTSRVEACVQQAKYGKKILIDVLSGAFECIQSHMCIHCAFIKLLN